MSQNIYCNEIFALLLKDKKYYFNLKHFFLEKKRKKFEKK